MSHSPSPKALIKQLDAVLCRDRFPLYRQLRELDRQPNAQKLEKILERYTQSALQVSQRLASIPPLHYDTQLPIADKKEQIKAAIAQHQVVIIAGETGSGKTTQLPKICLELGLGARNLINWSYSASTFSSAQRSHTDCRRITYPTGRVSGLSSTF